MNQYDSVYLIGRGGGYSGKIPLNFVHFNDGSYKVQIPNILRTALVEEFTVGCYADSLDYIGIVAQIIDILKRNTRLLNIRINLNWYSTLYTRYDRVMHEDGSDGLGSKIMCDMLASLGVDQIRLYDVHSSATINYLQSLGVRVEEETQDSIVHDYMMSLKDQHEYGGSINVAYYKSCTYNIVAPDAGSLKKLSVPNVICGKDRDDNTGEIKGFTIEYGLDLVKSSTNNKPYLIIDDICEKGGTFLGVVDILRNSGAKQDIELFVSHGIFPEGTSFEALDKAFSKITVAYMGGEAFSRCVQNFGSEKFKCLNVFKSI